MQSEPKSNHLFGADHISMTDCQLLETKYSLLHLRVLIHPANYFFQVRTEKHQEESKWANRAKGGSSFITTAPSHQLPSRPNLAVFHSQTISEIAISKQSLNAIPQMPLVVVLWIALELALQWYPVPATDQVGLSFALVNPHTFTRTRLPPKGFTISPQKIHEGYEKTRIPFKR